MGGGYNSKTLDEPITGEEALDIANTFLNKKNSGLTIKGHPDPFYCYYSIHTKKKENCWDAQRERFRRRGLSAYLELHGKFVDMTEHEDDNNSD